MLEYPEGKPEDVMVHNDLAGFVEFGTEEYTVYESDDFEIEGIMLERYGIGNKFQVAAVSGWKLYNLHVGNYDCMFCDCNWS